MSRYLDFVFQERQNRKFLIFLILLTILMWAAGACFWMRQTLAVRDLFLAREGAMVSSLLEQGVEVPVIAVAVTHTADDGSGTRFLSGIGISDQTAVRFLPFVSDFSQATGNFLLAAGVLLAVFLFTGVVIFLYQRERLYQEALWTVRRFTEGDYSRHLPQLQEGAVYQMFALVEQLATMLKARSETERETKEFLKRTISDISHQLKTPLAALAMYQEIIEDEPENPDTVRAFSVKSGAALNRMEQLIDAMLKITRLDAGNIVFRKESVPVSTLVHESVRDLVTRAGREQKQLIINGSENATLVCDREWTREAIGNLVKNALDHTEAGGVIQITWACTPAMLRITVSDNGRGIPPEDIYHIFKRFYRSRNSLDTQGAGLGLPLAKSIVEGQGGTISVQSTPGEGAKFVIAFLLEN